MNKRAQPPADNVWDDDSSTPAPTPTTRTLTPSEPAAASAPAGSLVGLYDIDGLMTDFPTARELERFVYDETGIVLNLKGRANKLKYQIAMDALNGQTIDQAFLGGENPYVEKSEMIPEEPMKELPARDRSLPDVSTLQNQFYCGTVPHSDPEYRAMDRRMDVVFRKYKNGMISYEVEGPIEPRPVGEKIDKFGRSRPEIIKWVDPRTGEQLVQREDGTLTPLGKRLRAMMQSFRVNTSNQWDVWVDREFGALDHTAMHNPWDLST
jgi:hypothetical protein